METVINEPKEQKQMGQDDSALLLPCIHTAFDLLN